ELWKARPLRDDQANHVLAPRAVDFSDEHVDDHLSHGADRHFAQRRGLDRAHEWAEHRAHEFLEEALLVAVVEENRPLRNVIAAGNIIEPCVGKAARGELLERSGEDGGAPFFAPGYTRILRGCVFAATCGGPRPSWVRHHACPASTLTDW